MSISHLENFLILTIAVTLIILYFLTICIVFKQIGFLPVKLSLLDRLFLFEVKSWPNFVYCNNETQYVKYVSC